MIIGNRKYKFSKGLSFYSELEALRVKEEAENGWHLTKLSRWGFLVFEKGEPEEMEATIDFYPGKKEDIAEYLELYQLSGWYLMASYRKRYFIFKAEKGTKPAYTDVESYETKMKKESNWLILQMLMFGLPALLLLLLLNFTPLISIFDYIPRGFKGMINLLLVTGTLTPFIGLALVTYFRVVYPKRKESFRDTDNFAKRQIFFRDMLLTMIIGGLIGGVIGFIMGYFNIF